MHLLIRAIREAIKSHQRNTGGRSYADHQDVIEPTCLAILSRRNQPCGYLERAVDFIERTQNPDGGWAAFTGYDQQSCWTTALAVDLQESSGAQSRLTDLFRKTRRCGPGFRRPAMPRLPTGGAVCHSPCARASRRPVPQVFFRIQRIWPPDQPWPARPVELASRPAKQSKRLGNKRSNSGPGHFQQSSRVLPPGRHGFASRPGRAAGGVTA